MAALMGVLGSGILRGVLIGVVLSLLMLLRRSSRPHTTELGRVPGTDFFADRVRHPENEREPGVAIFRVEGSILYFNVDHVRDHFMEIVNDSKETRLAIFFMGMVASIDLAGAELLAELHRVLASRGIEFRIAEARGNIRESLRRAGFEKECRPIEANQTVASIVSEWQGTTRSTVLV